MATSRELKFDSVDPFYRYQLSPLTVTLESGRTVLINLTVIAKELRIPVTWVAKLLEVACSAPCKYEEKRGHYVLSGTAQLDRLNTVISKFRSVILTCQTCKVPEVHLSIEGKGLDRNCDACGHHDFIPGIPKYSKVLKLIYTDLVQKKTKSKS